MHQLVWHWYDVETAVESSELNCYNTEGDKNSVVNQASSKTRWTILELQAETGIDLREALTEVEKWTLYAICHLIIFYFKIRIIHTIQENLTSFPSIFTFPCFFMFYQSCQKK